MNKIVLILLSISLQAWSGQEVGNGGGFSICRDQKYYSYDAILSVRNPFGPPSIGLSFPQRILTISAQLKRLQDPLAKEFDDFMGSLYLQVRGKAFQWFQQINLPMVWDPGLEAALPATCKIRKQAAYYMPPGGGVSYAAYTYDPVLLKKVLSQPEGDLQVSYLWVHEWLWNHFKHEDFIHLATFNRLLQSEGLNHISLAEYQRWRKQLLR